MAEEEVAVEQQGKKDKGKKGKKNKWDYNKWNNNQWGKDYKNNVNSAVNNYVNNVNKALRGNNPSRDITNAVYQMLNEMNINYNDYYSGYTEESA